MKGVLRSNNHSNNASTHQFNCIRSLTLPLLITKLFSLPPWSFSYVISPCCLCACRLNSLSLCPGYLRPSVLPSLPTPLQLACPVLSLDSLPPSSVSNLHHTPGLHPLPPQSINPSSFHSTLCLCPAKNLTVTVFALTYHFNASSNTVHSEF